MLKFFYLKDVLWPTYILFLSEIALSYPITTSNYPMVSSSDTNKLVCYMQTADGKTLNLDSLCVKQPPAPAQVVVSLNQEGDHITGSIVNKTDKTVTNPKINYEVISYDGSVMERGEAYTDSQTLSPGQTASFQNLIPDGAKSLRAISVEWDE